MKAYYVTEIGYGEYSRIIFAESRNKAKAEGAAELDRDYMEVTAVRAPKYDQYADDMAVPVEVLLQDGWWFTCHGINCGKQIYQDEIESGGRVIDGFPYCAECVKKGAK